MSVLAHIENLGVRYGSDTALNNLDLDINTGETLAIIGESGSGKSTLALALASLLPANARVSGAIQWSNGKPKPGRDVGFMFQDPASSFDPLMRVGAQLVETIRAHENINRHAAKDRALKLLARVQIAEPDSSFSRYPHQFSGGQKQRIAIARAVALRPDILVADEAVSALDVSVQAQVLELLAELQRDTGIAIIFITHDLRVAAQICDDVLVMKRGQVVEQGNASDVLGKPSHEYTRSLIEAAPGRFWDFAAGRPAA